MNTIEQSVIKAKLAELAYPIAKTSIQLDGAQVTITLQFGFPVTSIASTIQDQVKTLLSSLALPAVDIIIESKIRRHKTQLVNQSVSGVKNILVVASGKGGVGKSTTSVNLALALSEMGARVGLLDADIYGPNIPQMLGSSAADVAVENKKFHPVIAHGIQSISIAHLVDVNAPIAWRGPMISKMLEQLLWDTLWNDLDYLVIDLPPGTGDIQLTLGKKVPVSGAIMVTTPQDIALLDAKRGIEMFNKVQIPVLGLVENMAQHVCSQCGHAEAIFGEQGGVNMAADYAVPLLAQLPLSLEIREDCDQGVPSVIKSPEGAIAGAYFECALQVAMAIAKRDIDYSAKFPNISVVDK